MPTCKCVDCGLVARYNKNRELIEIDTVTRAKGGLPEGHENNPICSALAFNLPAEMPADKGYEAIVVVLNNERECNKFYPHRLGFSPKEHKAMQYEEAAELREKERREAERLWQLQQKREDRAWQVKLNIIITCLAFILAILLYIMGIRK